MKYDKKHLADLQSRTQKIWARSVFHWLHGFRKLVPGTYRHVSARDMLVQGWSIEARYHLGVSENRGTPKSSILIGISIKPSILGYPYFWKHPLPSRDWCTLCAGDGRWCWYEWPSGAGPFSVALSELIDWAANVRHKSWSCILIQTDS